MGLAQIRDNGMVFALRGMRAAGQVRRRIQRHIVSARRTRPAGGSHNDLVRTAALSLNLQVEDLPSQFLRISDGTTVIYSNDFNFSFESLTAYWMCGDKYLTSLLLQRAGIRVPEFRLFHSNDLGKALAAFSTLDCPLVVKPCFGSSGEGITVGVRTFREYRKACFRAATTSNGIIVEQFAKGRHFRITLLDQELIAAFERLPASVIGDGKSSISELIARRNCAIALNEGFPNAYPIRIDADTKWMLSNQNVSVHTVPPAGDTIVLKSVCNAAVGGSTVDVSRQVHPDYLTLARNAACVMGARLAGIDLIAPDVTLPIQTSDIFVNEVNTTPDLMLSHFDVSGCGDAVETARHVLSRAFGGKHEKRLPNSAGS
jgi:D-alanine-D-alanine ligase-like ATP-grasp enzyme